MKKHLALNTIISFSVRVLILMDLTVFIVWVYTAMRGGAHSDYIALEVLIARAAVVLLLIADWSTTRALERRFSKLIDTLLVLVWLVLTLPFVVMFEAIGFPAY